MLFEVPYDIDMVLVPRKEVRRSVVYHLKDRPSLPIPLTAQSGQIAYAIPPPTWVS